jgi:hypothetical protein
MLLHRFCIPTKPKDTRFAVRLSTTIIGVAGDGEVHIPRINDIPTGVRVSPAPTRDIKTS